MTTRTYRAAIIGERRRTPSIWSALDRRWLGDIGEIIKIKIGGSLAVASACGDWAPPAGTISGLVIFCRMIPAIRRRRWPFLHRRYRNSPWLKTPRDLPWLAHENSFWSTGCWLLRALRWAGAALCGAELPLFAASAARAAADDPAKMFTVILCAFAWYNRLGGRWNVAIFP
jgi:hypothetical protein